MNNWILNKKIIRLSIVAAVFCLAAYIFCLFLIMQKINKIEDIYNNIDSESSKGERAWAIQSIFDNNQSYVEALRGYFINKNDEVGFIKQIEEVAQNSLLEFEIDSIDIKTNEKDTFKEDVSIKMNIEGGWDNITSFLNKLEKMPFGVSIREVNLDSRVSGKWFGTIEIITFREK